MKWGITFTQAYTCTQLFFKYCLILFDPQNFTSAWARVAGSCVCVCVCAHEILFVCRLAQWRLLTSCFYCGFLFPRTFFFLQRLFAMHEHRYPLLFFCFLCFQAHFFLKNYDEAHAAYSRALELAPNDELIAQARCSCQYEHTNYTRKLHIHIYIYIYICMYICIRRAISIYICIYTHIYLNIYI